MGELKTPGNRKVRGGKGILHRYDRQRGEKRGKGRDKETKERGRGINGERGAVKGTN